MEETNRKVFTCPMHPEIVREKPGLCPECGMSLLPEHSKSATSHGHSKSHGRKDEFDKHAGHSVNIFARKFWVSFTLSIVVTLYSEFPQKILGWMPPEFAGSQYLALILSSVVFFYGGWIFMQGAYRELKARLPGMMTLIGLAITTAYAYSVYATFAAKDTLFWELTTLIAVMLLGHWIEMRAVSGAQGALKELSKLLPDTAEVLEGGATKTVPLAELKIGNIIFIRPGGKIPADAEIIEGQSEINESMITGESKPVKKSIGSEIIAGTINGDGSIKAGVTKIGESTFLSGVMRLVAEAQASKSRLQMLSDRAAFYLTIIAVVSGALTFALWFAAEAGIGFAMERLVAVLVIACPHALGLAIPLVASISTTLAARNGFLVKNRLALEAARKIDVVLFDKTGTLTKGEYGVEAVWPVAAKDENEVLAIAAAVDAHSEHFIARAIVAKAKEKNLSIPEVRNFERIPGKGAKGIVGGEEVKVGGHAIFEGASSAIPHEIDLQVKAESQKGKTIIYVLGRERVVGVIALADIIRPESREAVANLKKGGVKVAMITGDSEDVAKWVADDLGIDEYFAKVLPHEKTDKVKLLQERGLSVAMVGDGINDAPALTQADLGIAIGAGTNVAIESAGIILMRSDPRDITKIIALSRATYRKMIQNLFWATGYNIVALPLAAGVLASYGIFLQPAVAAIFMSLSTVIVAANAVLLRKVDIFKVSGEN